MLWLLLACRGGDDTRAYPAALAEVAAAPERALELCGSVRDEALRADCVLAGAEALAAKSPSRADALCAALPAGVSRDECAFQVAERADDPARCAGAGAFVDDCRLHLWSRGLRELLPAGARPGEVEEKVTTELARFGFDPADNRPWSALYRELLARQRPLDRQTCERAPTEEQRESCRMTGVVVYNDRLNVARDRKQVPCNGGALPAMLQTTPDPELERLYQTRLAVDLCSPR